MVQVDLQKLFDRLNPLCNHTLELAIATCVKRTNYNVEMEHWLSMLVDSGDSDFVRILESFEVDLTKVKTDLTKNLDRLKTGNAKSPALSPDVVELATDAWTIATINYSAGQIRSGHLIIALLSSESLKRAAVTASREFDKISVESLRKEHRRDVRRYARGSRSNESSQCGGAEPPAADGTRRRNTPSLDQFTIDLTARARDGKIDAVLGETWRFGRSSIFSLAVDRTIRFSPVRQVLENSRCRRFCTACSCRGCSGSTQGSCGQNARSRSVAGGGRS